MKKIIMVTLTTSAVLSIMVFPCCAVSNKHQRMLDPDW
jgi:hypothetical protein